MSASDRQPGGGTKRVALAVLAAVLPGCGYTAGMPGEARGLRTVAIGIVANDTFRQRLEIPLTRNLYELLPIHTSMRPAPADRADALLEVRIADIAGRSLVQGVQDPVREGALDYRVTVRLVERTTGRLLTERTILDRAEFRSPIQEDQGSAEREAAADLARKIVLALEPGF